MKPSCAMIGAVLASVGGLPEPAGAEAPRTWYCWYGSDQPAHITCFQPDAGNNDGLEAAEAALVPLSSQAFHGRNGAARYYRDSARAVPGRTILVPLHTIPFDLASLQELAEAVICSRRQCIVAFDDDARAAGLPVAPPARRSRVSVR